MSLSIVILAAGQGKRMYSSLPKVLHLLAGKPLLLHVIDSTLLLDSLPPIIVVGHESERVCAAIDTININSITCKQQEPLGTGHAVLQALPYISDTDNVLILYGDVPLIQSDTLNEFIQQIPPKAIGIITARLPDPAQFGRIIRDKAGNIKQIIEERDANTAQKTIQEINSGIYLIPANYLKKWLPLLTNINTQKEFYLTDIMTFAVKENISIHSYSPKHYQEILGVNDCLQLAQLERFYQLRYAEKLMQAGVRFCDPARFDNRGELTIGKDCLIDINVIFEGKVTIGNNCQIGANSLLRNTTVGDYVNIKPYSVIDGAMIDTHAVIGPFARIRANTHIASHAEIGNFIEIKNSHIGEHTKIHHVGYIGDSELGKRTNIGAGTITCNYDGVNKHKTIIGDNAFIGSNTELVAPVTIGEGATIGAGSTITRDAPSHQLTLSRSPQRSIAHWQRPKKIQEET